MQPLRTAVFLLMAWLGFISPASPDDFALNEGAYGPQPLDVAAGDESPVRLVEEHLLFRFGRTYTYVVAQFLFENTLSDSTVHQLSGFPDISLGEDWDAFERVFSSDLEGEVPNSMGSLEDMETYVDGQPVESKVRYGYVRESSRIPWAWLPADSTTGRRVGWYLVDLIIPPGGRTTLERRYKTMNGGDGIGGAHFYYITLTGGPWQGPIGTLTADVVLEDGLTVDDLDWRAPDSPGGWGRVSPPRGSWRIESPSSLRLIWSRFEPMTDPSRHFIVLVWRPEDRLEWGK